jgi:hypothetical protein
MQKVALLITIQDLVVAALTTAVTEMSKAVVAVVVMESLPVTVAPTMAVTTVEETTMEIPAVEALEAAY